MSKSSPAETRKNSRNAGTVRIALAGNPNSGKTTIFNNLTGARQHVGNYPGVTVEIKEGTCRFAGRELSVVDLPGTYSLTAYSMEEVIARNHVVHESPDVVVDIVDASNLERNLYLAVQFMELRAPLVIALNMSDLAKSRGLKIDVEKLSKLLGVPIVPTVGHRNRGTDELLEAVLQVAENPDLGRGKPVTHGKELEEELEKVGSKLAGQTGEYPPRWLALKLLENDAEVRKLVSEQVPGAEQVFEQTDSSTRHLRTVFGDDPEALIADSRYGFISGACTEAVGSAAEIRHTRSDKIDKVICNRVVAIPIFLLMMWLVFKLTFTLGGPPMDWIDAGFGWLGGLLEEMLPEGLLRSLLVDGIIAGVGGVIIFLPNILLLFLGIAFLEDSGYMARAAFIMDRLMHKIGLHGKSFIPMLIGFGCTIPAVMATRTLENRRDRIITIMVSPLMSCGARWPVYVLLSGLFFPQYTVWCIFSIYVLGIVLAIIMAKVFGKWLLPGTSAPFVMELPPYRMPTLKGVLIHMWERGWLYLKKAGTIILVIAVAVWVLSTFPRNEESITETYKAKIEAAAGDEETLAEIENEISEKQLEQTYAGQIGRVIAPVLKPIGLGDWKIGTALFAGFGAKEVVVSTMGTLYSLGEVDPPEELPTPDEEGKYQLSPLQTAMKSDPAYSPLVACVFMVFVLIYVPCMAVVAVVKRETNSWRWPIFMVTYTTALAWVVSGIVYWGGRLLGLGMG